jgi:hypothetical protein
MKISLEKAIALIQLAEAAVFDDTAVTYARIQDGDSCFMQASWEDAGGHGWAFDFYEEDNQEVEVVGNSIWMTPTVDGDPDPPEPVQITLLFSRNLEELILHAT